MCLSRLSAHLRQLTEFIQGRRYFAPDECPLGGWALMREPATPATTIVSPNVDTLYGASYLLLDKQGPVVLSVPPIPGRYYSVTLLDAYCNNFAIISPRTYGSGGAYLLTPPGWSGEPAPILRPPALRPWRSCSAQPASAPVRLASPGRPTAA